MALGRFNRSAILAAGLLAGLAGSATAEEARRSSAQSFGPLPPHPAVAELAPRALQDIDALFRDGLARFEATRGVRCPGTREEWERARMGARLYEQMERAWAMSGLSADRTTRDAYLVMLSGECPVGGAFSGPVEFILVIEEGTQYDAALSVVHSRHHVAGFFADGEPVGESVTASAVSASMFHVLASGELIPFKTDDANVQRMQDQITYAVSYMTLDREGRLVRPAVGFSQGDLDPKTMISVASSVDAHRRVMEMYVDGALMTRSRLKDGINHGWTEMGPAMGGVPPTCWQNGQITMSPDCPDN